MNSLKEKSLYIGVLLIFSGLLLSFGKKEIQLQKEIPITSEELYSVLKTNAGIQIIDVRPYESQDSDEDFVSYVDEHIPNSIPFPNCDEKETPKEALEHINPYLPTIIVSRDGDPEIFKKCAQKFTIVKNLQGGIIAWDDAGYPEDGDKYTPPQVGVGGGCGSGGNEVSIVYSW